MITRVDPVSSMFPDLTGNSSIAEVGTDIYVVSNVRTDGTAVIYKSIDRGRNFSIVHTINLPIGTKKFDPVVISDGTDIHFVGSVASTDIQKYDIIKYKYTVSTDVETNTILVTGNLNHAGYDIIQKADGTFQVAVSVLQPLTPINIDNSILCFILDQSGSILNYSAILGPGLPNNNSNATSIGGISLVNNTADPTSVDVYYTQHPRALLFKDQTISINKIVTTPDISGGFTVGTAIGILDVSARYTEDKLTVLKTQSNDLILTSSYYTQVASGVLSSTSVIGYLAASSPIWSFKELKGSTNVSWLEPTPSINQVDEIYISILQFDINNGIVSDSGSFRTYQLDTMSMGLTEIPNNFSTKYTTLRGSKDVIDSLSDWFILGYIYNKTVGAGDVYYISHLNLPPVVSVSPSSLTLVRGVSTEIDASTTYDPDMDPITFQWTSNDITGFFHIIGSGNKIQVLVDKQIGPAATTIDVTLTVTDTPPTGVPANPPVSVVIPVTIALNNAPTITMPGAGSYNATRNETYTIIPTVSDVELDTLTFQWAQTAGTVVPIYNTTSKDLKVELYRTDVTGETLAFQLTVSDGINTPVTSTMSVSVPAISMNLMDSAELKYTGPTSNKMALRNTSSSWVSATFVDPGLTSDSSRMKISYDINSNIRRSYISNKSVLVTNDFGSVSPTFYRRRIAYRGTVLDAVHVEDNTTYLLVSYSNSLYLMKYSSSGHNNISDYPDQEISLESITTGSFDRITCTISNKGYRVFLLYGTSGILLLQVSTSDITDIRQNIYISTSTSMLSGADNITFIKFNNIDSLNDGQLLIGSVDSVGNTYETLLNLSDRRVVGTWDKSNTLSAKVVTGEMLNKSPKDYSGILQAPVLNTPLVSGSNIILSWSQTRNDLVDYYELEADIDNTTFSLLKRITSGIILSTVVNNTDIFNHIYKFRIRSFNGDGSSTYSNIVQVGDFVSNQFGVGQYGYGWDTYVPPPIPVPIVENFSVMTVLGNYSDARIVSMTEYNESIQQDLSASNLGLFGGSDYGSDGFLYVAYDRCIYKVDTTNGTNTVFAGNPSTSGYLDATGTSALFTGLIDCRWHQDGNLYAIEGGSPISTQTYNRIRKITTGGVVTTVATIGTPNQNGLMGLAIHPTTGDLYVSDLGRNVIWKVTTAGVSTLVAGTDGWSGYVDGTGTAAQFYGPWGLSFDATGSTLYIVDELNNAIRSMTVPGYVVTSLVGAGYSGYQDGIGSNAWFRDPLRISRVQSDGTFLVADANNYMIRKFDPATNSVSTVFSSDLGHPKGIYPTSSINSIFAVSDANGVSITHVEKAATLSDVRFRGLFGIDTASTGDIYSIEGYWNGPSLVGDLRKTTATMSSILMKIAPTATDGAVPGIATMNSPWRIACNRSTGDIYFSDVIYLAGNRRSLRKISGSVCSTIDIYFNYISDLKFNPTFSLLYIIDDDFAGTKSLYSFDVSTNLLSPLILSTTSPINLFAILPASDGKVYTITHDSSADRYDLGFVSGSSITNITIIPRTGTEKVLDFREHVSGRFIILMEQKIVKYDISTGVFTTVLGDTAIGSSDTTPISFNVSNAVLANPQNSKSYFTNENTIRYVSW